MSGDVTVARLRINRLFDLFVHGVLVAVAAELLQLNPTRGVSTVFGRSVARDTGRSLVEIAPALCAF